MKFSWKSVIKNIPLGLKIIGITLVLAAVSCLFVFSSFKIPSWSMEPAVTAGDYILVNKLVYGGGFPKISSL